MADEPLLDRAHLITQTGGDAELAAELLALFVEQCRRLLPGIADAAGTDRDRADLAHTLKGSALGIGATRVAVHAAAAEDRLRAAEGALPPIPDLTDAVEATIEAIARYA